MAEKSTRTEESPREQPADAQQLAADADDAERRLGRLIAIGLPIVTIVAALAVGIVASMGPAILVLAGGALVGTVALLWASLRTLGGDAPLPQDLEQLSASAESFSDVAERKRSVLRALKDLELERDIGKMDPEDYASIAAHYRDQAKAILREIDEDVEPFRARAEDLAKKHLARRGLEADGKDAKKVRDPAEDAERDEELPPSNPAPEADAASDEDDDASPVPGRVACPKCATSNESDAAFCKKCGTALREAADAQV